MFKRALALLLTACMMFDSSAITALAAEPQTEVVSEVDTEAIDTEETEIVSEDVIIEEETSSELTTEEAVTESEVITETEVVIETEEVTEEEVVTEIEEVTETEETVTEENLVLLGETAYPELTVGTTNVTLPANTGYLQYVDYIFTTPESGIYTLNAKTPDTYDSSYVEMYSDEEFESIIGSGYMYMYSEANIITPQMQTGDSIYIRLYTYADTDITASMTMKKLPTYTLVKQEDGSYTADAEDYTFQTKMEAGYQNLRGEVSLTAKEGVVLADNYYVKTMAKTINGVHNLTHQNTTSLYGTSDYTGMTTVQVEQGNQYNLYYILQDYDTCENLAVFESDILLTIGTTDEKYHVHNISTTETSVTFDLEMMYYGTCYYAPTDGSEEEHYVGTSSGWHDLTVYNLIPGTEYYFEFVDYNSNLLGRVVATTEVSTTVFEYDAAMLEDGATLKLLVDVSNYQGDATYAYFNYKFTDELGCELSMISSKYIGNLEADPETGKTFQITASMNPAFVAGETYDIELWVELNNVKYGKTEKSVTVPETAVMEDDITFTVEPREEAEGYVDYVVDVANVEEWIDGILYYRLMGDEVYMSQPVSVSPSNNTGFVSNLQTGSTYEFVVFICGIRKDAIVTVGTPTIQLMSVEESAVDNSFDIIREFKVESAEELEDTYYLKMYYMTEGYTSWQPFAYDSAVELKAANGYQAQFKTADFAQLMPDTEYKVKWVLTTYQYSSNGYCIFETFTTKEADLTIENTKSYINKQEFSIILNPESVANFDDFYANVYAYVSESGKNSYRQMNSTYLSSDNNYTTTMSIDGLKPNTQYDVSMRSNSGKDYVEYKIVTFTTPVDSRKIVIDEPIKTYLNRAEISYMVEGLDAVDETCIQLYVKELEETEWTSLDSWNYDSDYTDNYEGVKTFHISYYKGEKLKEDTTYEYKIGFGDSNTTVNNLEHVEKGKFTTLKDTREIIIGEEEAGFHRADLPYTLSGMDVVDHTCIVLYIKEGSKESENVWEYATNNYYSTGDSNTGYFYVQRYNNEELKADTTYSYVVGFGNNYNEPMDRLVHTKEGSFKTAKDTRTIKVSTSVSYTKAKLGVEFSGNDFEINSYIHYFYKVKGEESWISLGYDRAWEKEDSFTRDIQNLAFVTEYDYAVVIADSWDCNSPEDIPEGLRKVEGTFKTKENEYKLTFEQNVEKTTINKVVVDVTAIGCTEDNYVSVELTLYDANGQTAVQMQEIMLKRGNGYTKEITFNNLAPSTEYMIKKASFRVSENNSMINIGEDDYEYKIKTKEAEKPTKITLDKTSLALNLNYSESATLETQLRPDGAIGSLKWTSSDENVATVASNGTVKSVGCGEAIITVSLADNEDVKATCKVVVEKYAIFRVIDENNEENYPSYGMKKGDSLGGFGYYKMNENAPKELLTGYNVTMSKSNVVSFANGTLTAIGVGGTYVYFEKDGVKASIYVSVSVDPVGFGITGFTSSDASLPAIKDEKGNYTLVWCNNTTYTAVGETSPVQVFDATQFNWESSDKDVATAVNGVIIPVGSGTTVLKVTPINNGTENPYIQDSVEITLYIKDLPRVMDVDPIYAFTNTAKKLGDLKLPAEYDTSIWAWKYPNTPLVVNGVNNKVYKFEIVYTGEKCYPCETTVPVYIGNITGLTFADVSAKNHKQYLQADGKDSIKLAIGATGQGAIGNYTIEIPEMEGLTITKDGSYYNITASKVGKYTIKPIIKVDGVEFKFKKAPSYTITAVDTKLAGDITLSSTTVDTSGKVIFEAGNAKNFDLVATVKDLTGAEFKDAKLEWKTSDKTVVTVKADSKDSHKATVTAKGEGHAIITVIAKDNVKYQVQLDVEIQNHKPRLNKNSVAINLAYDYDNWNGMNLAYAAGNIELVPVYGESISGIWFTDKEGKTVNDIEVRNYGGTYNYLFAPANDTIATGKRSYKMHVRTSADKEYEYDFTINVSNKAPTVKVSKNNAVNLFYTTSSADITLSISNNARISSATWVDNAEGVNNGFEMYSWYGYSKNKYVSYVNVSQEEDISVVKGKLQDENVAKGTLTIKLTGYKKTYTFEDFTVKYTYKKPKLVTKNATTEIAPEFGDRSNYFWIYNQTEKRNIWYDKQYVASNYYNEITCDDANISLESYNNSVDYRYTGTKSSHKFTMTLDSLAWRESIDITHTTKVKNPSAKLGTSTVTLNIAENAASTAYAYIYSTTSSSVNLSDIEIKGTNNTAQKLIEENLLTFKSYGTTITIEQNHDDMLPTQLAKGTYKFKVTPYYMSTATGVKKALKALSLTVKVVDKPVTATIKPSGSIDLAYGDYYSSYNKKNVIFVNPKFGNLATGDEVLSCKLTGEYSTYFTLHDEYSQDYVTVNTSYLGSLKSGQSYKLAIEYTMINQKGDTYTVTSNTFNIKPKQSKPKLTISGNNQVFYAGNDSLSRTYYVSVPNYYTIESVSGGLDCNKDGIIDIRVSTNYNDGYECGLSVSIVDRDAVTATAKGKKYKIPLTVRVEGRDGITKDATVNIEVTVKR